MTYSLMFFPGDILTLIAGGNIIVEEIVSPDSFLCDGLLFKREQIQSLVRHQWPYYWDWESWIKKILRIA